MDSDLEFSIHVMGFPLSWRSHAEVSAQLYDCFTVCNYRIRSLEVDLKQVYTLNKREILQQEFPFLKPLHQCSILRFRRIDQPF